MQYTLCTICTVQPNSFGMHVGYAKVSPGTYVVSRGDVNGLQVYRYVKHNKVTEISHSQSDLLSSSNL